MELIQLLTKLKFQHLPAVGESYRLNEKRKAGLLGRAPVMKPEQLSETD